jgi:hypothetical protein
MTASYKLSHIAHLSALIVPLYPGDDASGPAKGARTSDSGSTGSGRRTSQADGTVRDALH